MINANPFCRNSSWIGARAILALPLLLLLIIDTASAQTNHNINFDHIRTGFPLTGAHQQLPCETCHIQGIFKGTPKKCETCHTPGSRIQTTTVKPSNHIPTTLGCAQCHNGSFTTGKPANHVMTAAPCDSCHRTTTWMSAGFNHIGVTPGTCATCHGVTATGKPSNHIPTTLSCDACHTMNGTFATSTFTHSAVQGVLPGQCANCHNGSFASMNALGKPSGHVVTTASCDTCHTGFSTFASATFDHTGVTPGTCATCHTQGGSGMAKPTNHIPTTLSCDLCHTTGGTFSTSTFTHSAAQGVVPGQCSTCHNGAYTAWNALGKPSNHLATTASCDICHAGYTTFANGVFNHTGIAPGTCETCHTPGGAGLAAPNNHIPYKTQLLAGTSMSCDACHTSTTSFTIETMNHNNSPGNGAGWCKGCHASGTSYLGNMQKMSLTHQQSTGVTDCSQSGCHRPLGNKGTTYRSWD